jgi:hypothetical protein
VPSRDIVKVGSATGKKKKLWNTGVSNIMYREMNILLHAFMNS